MALQALLVLFLLASAADSAASDGDASAMLKLRKSLTPTPSGWADTGDHCKWSGVKCDSSNRVIAIDLASRSLSGSLPLELNFLTELTTLSFSNNTLSGPIPDIFDSFSKLQHVILSYNNLIGSLPKTFAGSGIKTLRLNNQFSGLTGTLDVLSHMSELAEVWLHYNQFTGPVPDFSRSLAALSDLNLRNNLLTGVVPATLMSLTALQSVSLENNRLQGPVPEFIAAKATFGGNNFCKTVPGPCDRQVTVLLEVAADFGYPLVLAHSWRGNNVCVSWRFISCDSSNSVVWVDFGRMHFGGRISPALANLTALKMLILSSNNLVGQIPECLTTLTQLQLFDATDNSLSGEIPNFRPQVNLFTDGNPLLGITHSPPSVSHTHPPSLMLTLIIVVSALLVIGLVIGLLVFLLKRKQEVSGVVSNSQPSMDSSISIEMVKRATENFNPSNFLGKGGFSSVYKGAMEDGSVVAVKKMDRKKNGRVNANALKAFNSEVGILTKVRHTYLVALIGYCQDEENLIVVYEYMAQGTLGRHLFDWRNEGLQPLDWRKRLVIASNIARGLEYIHNYANKKLVHRDLKSSNILLGDDFQAKVADFGLVHLCSSKDKSSSSFTEAAGTPGYWAPECILYGDITDKADVYSFGVILMELITGKKSVGEHWSTEDVNLRTWFRKVLIKDGDLDMKELLTSVVDAEIISAEEQTVSCFRAVAQLAVYCTENAPERRPHMSHAVLELAWLVEEPWRPLGLEPEEDLVDGINSKMSLQERLEMWKEEDKYGESTSSRFGTTWKFGEGTSTMFDEGQDVDEERLLGMHEVAVVAVNNSTC